LVKWYKNELNSTANHKYPSKVLGRIKSAIKQLNDHPEVPFSFLLKKKNGIYKLEIYRKEGVPLKKEIPFDHLPGFLKRVVISLIERKKHIREPFALARSMSWKEIENLLKKLVMVEVSKDAWEGVEFIKERTQNPSHRKELELLAAEETNDSFITIVMLKKKLKGLLADYLDSFAPNWKTFLHDAVGYAEEKNWSQGMENESIRKKPNSP